MYQILWIYRKLKGKIFLNAFLIFNKYKLYNDHLFALININLNFKCLKSHISLNLTFALDFIILWLFNMFLYEILMPSNIFNIKFFKFNYVILTLY